MVTEDQLYAFAVMANKRWPKDGKFRWHGNMLDLHHPSKPEYVWDYFTTLKDFDNAEFIIWALERMVEMGLNPLLHLRDSSHCLVAGSEEPCIIHEDEFGNREYSDGTPYNPPPFPVCREPFYAATRAEAVFLALCRALNVADDVAQVNPAPIVTTCSHAALAHDHAEGKQEEVLP